MKPKPKGKAAKKSPKRKTAPSLCVLGVMTGTSCDGLDAACLDLSLDGCEPIWSASAPYPAPLRARVLEAQAPDFRAPIRSWLELNRDLGDWYGATLLEMIRARGEVPDAIANHGQTVAHYPAEGRKGTTLQLGEPTRIAAVTGVTVISNFREGDLAAGGQGAPLAPLFHRILASALEPSGSGIAIHNIGGISNLTYFGPKHQVLAFDTGPGNAWIDAAAAKVSGGKETMDTDGRLATQGRVDAPAVKELMRNPYFSAPPPKSTGRDDFPFELFSRETRAQGANLVATAMQVTIESIAQAYEKFVLEKGLPLKAVYLCGGGAKNPALVEALRIRLPKIAIRQLSDAGFDPQLIEAQAFAFFGFMALIGSPIGGAWTGARGFGPPAHIIPGENWPALMAKIGNWPL